jgi:hypothetical protein
MWKSLAATGTVAFVLVDPTLGVAQGAPGARATHAKGVVLGCTG